MFASGRYFLHTPQRLGANKPEGDVLIGRPLLQKGIDP
jgi:hypothetical protein